jgi:hypothetical protein
MRARGTRRIRILLGLALLAGCGDSPVRSDARAPADAGVVADAGDARVGVECGDEPCDPGETCCAEVLVPPTRSLYCTPGPRMCGGTAFTCDGPEDCDAGICCSDGEGLVACVSDTSCPDARACHGDGDCPGQERCCDTPAGVIRVCLAGACP